MTQQVATGSDNEQSGRLENNDEDAAGRRVESTKKKTKKGVPVDRADGKIDLKQSQKSRKEQTVKDKKACSIDDSNSDLPDESRACTSNRPKRDSQKVPNYNVGEDDVLDDSFLDEDYKATPDEDITSDSGNDSLEIECNPTGKCSSRSRNINGSKKTWVKWSNEEVSAIQNGFQCNLLNNRMPRKADVERVVSKYPVLKGRSWTQIKSKVQNLVKRKAKISSSIMQRAKRQSVRK